MTENNPTPPEGQPGQPPAPPPPPGSVPYAAPDGTYIGPPPTSDAKTMAMLAHLLNIIFLVPLLIYLLKKDSHPFVEHQSKEALNFSLLCLIAHIICSVTAFLCIPALIAMVVVILQIVFGIMGAVKVNGGQPFRYPFNVRMIK